MGEAVCEQRAPDLSCLAVARPRGPSVPVTLRACVETFGIGATSYGLTVTVLPEKKPDGSPADPGYDVAGAPGSQAERTAPLARGISTEVPATECPDQGYVELRNVPTETDLVVRVTQQQLPGANRSYVDTYQYGLMLPNSDVVDATGVAVATPTAACATTDCFARETVNTVQNATYLTIARAAGVTAVVGEGDLYDGVGQGHIAGQVQDCSSKDRLQNAIVGFSVAPRKTSYFDVGFGPREGKLEKANPSSTRTMTNADGLYVGLAINTMLGGVPVTVGAVVTPDVCGPDDVCQCIEAATNPAWTAPDPGEAETKVLGARRVFVFPDSITILTFDRNLYTSP